MKKHLWWIIPGVFGVAVIANEFTYDQLKIAACIALGVIAVLVNYVFDELRKKQAYSAYAPILHHEEKLDDLAQPKNKEKPYRKSDGIIWEMADAALSCYSVPNSEEYKEILWQRTKAKSRSWGA